MTKLASYMKTTNIRCCRTIMTNCPVTSISKLTFCMKISNIFITNLLWTSFLSVRISVSKLASYMKIFQLLYDKLLLTSHYFSGNPCQNWLLTGNFLLQIVFEYSSFLLEHWYQNWLRTWKFSNFLW